MKYLFLILCSVLFLTSTSFCQQKKPTVVVIDFNVITGASQNDAQILTVQFISSLSQTDMFRVLQRSDMEAILKEQNFSRSDLVDNNVAVKFGKMVAAEKIITGDLGKLGQTYTLTLNLITVETGEIEKSINDKYKGDIDGMLDLVSSMAQKISGVQSKQELSQQSTSTNIDEGPQLDVSLNQNRYAVIIGIEQYKTAPNADFAANDANAFKVYAAKAFGVPEENIYFKVNENATKVEFDKIFSQNGWLAKRTKNNPDAEVIVFYSGHGSPDIDSKEAYLIAYDSDPNYAGATGYKLSDIYSNITAMKIKKSVFFLDACFSGVSYRGEKQQTLTAVKGITLVPKIPKAPRGMTVFSASQDNQYSTIYPDKKHGLFTYYLFAAIKDPETDINHDNKLSANEIFSYINKKIVSTAVQLDKEQNPTLQTENPDQMLIELKKK